MSCDNCTCKDKPDLNLVQEVQRLDSKCTNEQLIMLALYAMLKILFDRFRVEPAIDLQAIFKLLLIRAYPAKQPVSDCVDTSDT